MFGWITRFLQKKSPPATQHIHDWGFLQWDPVRLLHHRTCRECEVTEEGLFREGRIVPIDHNATLSNGRTVREELAEDANLTAHSKGV